MSESAASLVDPSNDEEWLRLVASSREEILAALKHAFPHPGGIRVGAEGMVERAATTSPAWCVFDIGITSLTAAMAESAEAEQRHLATLAADIHGAISWRTLLSLIGPAKTLTPRGFAQIMRKALSPRAIPGLAIARKAEAERLDQECAHLALCAAAWLLEARTVALMAGAGPDTEGWSSLFAAADHWRAALTPAPGASGGRTMELEVAGYRREVQTPARKRKATALTLAWPGLIGADLRDEVDDPVWVAARAGDNGELLVGEAGACIWVAGAPMSLPLSDQARRTLRDMASDSPDDVSGFVVRPPPGASGVERVHVRRAEIGEGEKVYVFRGIGGSNNFR